MTKVVINTCHGGFRLSNEAAFRFAEKKNVRVVTDVDGDVRWFLRDQPFGEPVEISEELYERGDLASMHYVDRDDPVLVDVVEELGDAANNRYSELKIVEVPDDVQWHIAEYDGVEHVAEDHRTWQ